MKEIEEEHRFGQKDAFAVEDEAKPLPRSVVRRDPFLLLDGEWVTPVLAAGVLPGVMRSVLLDDPSWRAREERVSLDDLYRAERIVVCNALRGVVDARLAGQWATDEP